MIRRSKHLLVGLTAASAVVASIDCFGWLGWQSVSGTLAVNSEAGALRLSASAGVYLPSFVERSRRLSVRDLGTASREVVIVALGRLGSRQVFWFGANAVGFTNLALQSLLRDQSDEALGYLGQGLSRDPTSPHLHRLRALVLAAPWTHGDHHLTTMQNLRIAAARALDPVSYARFNAALLFPPGYRRANEAGFDRIAELALAKPQDADEIAGRLNAIVSFDARPMLERVACPTLVATAADDQLMPSWFARDTVNAIANSELCALDGGGHMLLETRAAEFSAIASDFLRQHK